MEKAGRALIKVDYLAPPTDMADFITAFYLFESDEGTLEDLERADMAQYRMIISGEARQKFHDGSEQEWPETSVFGPRTRASTVIASGNPMRMFGCGITAAGWAAVMTLPAHACANRVIGASEVLAGQYIGLADKIRVAPNLREMADLVIERSRDLLGARRHSLPTALISAVNAWLDSSLAAEISDLEAATGLSRRQLERQTRQYFGAPPKMLARKFRALRAANAIAHGTEDWQSYVDGAFYDQSHFIREIKYFTGLTPSAVRNAKSPLSAATFARSVLTGDVGPLVADT
jgi:AraC-like DNA-binding protein